VRYTPKRLLLFLIILLIGALILIGFHGRLRLPLGSLEGDSWKVRGLALELVWRGPDPSGFRVIAAQVELPPANIVRDVRFRCSDLRISTDLVECRDGDVQVQDPRLDQASFKIDFSYRRRAEALEYVLREIAVAGGGLRVTGLADARRWQIRLDGNKIEITRVPLLLHDFVTLPALNGYGELTFAMTLSGLDDGFDKAAIKATIRTRSLSTADGAIATENLNAVIEAQAKALDADFSLQGSLSLQQGQLYIDPIYLEVQGKPLHARATATWRSETGALHIDRLEVDHPGVMQARAAARIQFPLGEEVFESIDLKVIDGRLPGFYLTYIQPFLFGTGLDTLDTAGTVVIDFNSMQRGPTSIRLKLEDVHLDDQQGRYGLYGINGETRWRNTGPPVPSRIRWGSGHVYKLDLGATQLYAESSGADFRLTRQAEIPVLDGRLVVERLGVERAGRPDAQWQFKGVLDAVPLETLSRQLDWPIMSGRLAGVIPTVRYADGILEMGGELRIQAFDGKIAVRHLRLERPFGPAPSLSADIDLDNLDLDALTRTFSFGNIQGRLSGKIHKLRLENWEPASFDAEFATPPGDRSRHRISQKAVENLTSLTGGGLGTALSRSALRVFNEFSYSRIGLRCRLKDNVCEMGGVGPAQNGYYIVKGGGLPRIDVIAYNRRVDWPVLVERLKNVSRAQEAVIR